MKLFFTPEKIKAFCENVTEFSLYALLFCTPFAPAGVESLAGLAILSFIIKNIYKPELGFLKKREFLVLGAFFLISALSMLNSGPYLVKSIKALVFKWAEYLLIFTVISGTMVDEKRIRRALMAVLFIAAVVGMDGVFQSLFGFDFLRHRHISGTVPIYPVIGPFKHYNDFATYLVVAVSLFMAVIFSGELKGRGYLKIIFIFSAVFLNLTLLLTTSRGGWLAYGVSLIFMLSLGRKKSAAIFLILFVAAIVSIPELHNRIMMTFRAGGDQDRFLLWKTAWRMIEENPFLGKGVGNFMSYFTKYKPPSIWVTEYAHNCFLQIWAEIGIFGLLAFLLLNLMIIYKGIKLFLKNHDFILLGVTAGIIGYLVHSFFDTPLYSLQLSVLYWAMLGILLSLITLESKVNLIR